MNIAKGKITTSDDMIRKGRGFIPPVTGGRNILDASEKYFPYVSELATSR